MNPDQHTRSTAIDIPVFETRPAAQSVRVAQAVAGLPSWSQVLPPQGAAGVVSPAQYSPGLHVAHTGAVVLVPATLCTVPAAHMPCARHIERLSMAV